MLIKRIIKYIIAKRQYKKYLWSIVDYHNMRSEILLSMENNMSLEQAMMEWDIYPFNI